MSDGLRALITMAAQTVPGLDGQLAAHGAPAWHAGARIDAVRGLWLRRHPEAGPLYAALRGWGLLVWQPAYLAVIAAHVADAQPDLDRLSLVVHDDGEIGGYALAPHALQPDDEAGRMQAGAEQLAAGFARLLPAWQAGAPLPPKLALRTCADCVLAALLAVQRRLAWSPARTRVAGEAWLEALGLRGQSGFFAYRTSAGDEALALARKVCCLHFRRRDGERCSTCPKRPMDQRIACLRHEA